MPGGHVIWKVAVVQPVTEGFGFNITTETNLPLVSFAYATRADAETAATHGPMLFGFCEYRGPIWRLRQSIARLNLPGIAASGLQKRDWLVVDGNIKNWLPVLTVGIGDDAGIPRAAPIGKPYLVAFFHSFVSCLSARIARPRVAISNAPAVTRC